VTDDCSSGLRRTRRTAALAIALAGMLDLASAVTPPLRNRLQDLLLLVPLAVPQVATALVALSGLALLLLSRGIRRGQRHAWQSALVLLLGSVVLHVVKGVDLEEAAAAAAVSVYLLRHRQAFRTGADPASVRQGLLTLTAGALGAIVLGAVTIEALDRHPRPPVRSALVGAADRLVGVSSSLRVGDRLDDFLVPALLAIGVGIAIGAGWLLFRPIVRRVRPRGDVDWPRARAIVGRHGGDTLAYFALRDDKSHFFWGDTLVAYAVVGGVCLVSPDPVGPVHQRMHAWTAFRQFVDANGWAVAVMGATEPWLPIYQEAGMRDIYVGDEAVVDCSTFSLDGGRFKGLRQAVNRVARNGYRVEFHDPSSIAEPLRAQLQDVLTRSRQGEAERGFSMTLGRTFDPDDCGLLLAVCFGPSGVPVAFCQFVPAPAIDGYSLDVMRRDSGDHPNGVIDFIVVETIRHLRAAGMRGLGLNFATMRAVLAGEGTGHGERLKRWLLLRMSDSMQIESLWKYNAKFDPAWQPRYAVYDAGENILPAALAVARAESFWELPVIGRFLTPEDAPKEHEPQPV
jgi:lysylphosphatidylglycerol synthetase-like protein (DUF2156 family)